MSNQNIILILVLLLLVGCFPRWGYNTSWGYGPFGLIGGFLVILLFLRVFGVI